VRGSRKESTTAQKAILFQIRFFVIGFLVLFVGGGFFRGFSAVLLPASNTYFFDDAKSFAMVFGGGIDIRASKHISVRAIQADYNPTFFGQGRQDNFRLSFGVVFTK
jgi:hypothetical protein